ncbi:MAG: hypothetical protein JNK87_26380 [Bryobacterales bacterium]|nr:hypothetical protein [Bryobacterales bacterium]
MKLLLAEPDNFATAARELLTPLFDVKTCNDSSRDGVLRSLPTADVLWVRLRHHVDDAMLATAPRLKAIVSATTGVNHIDLEAAARRNIAVLTLRGETDFLRQVAATAELTLGLMLSLLRHIPDAVWHTHEGDWNRDQFRGHELTGRTVGIIGYGRLGRAVSRYLLPFGCKLYASDLPNASRDAEPGVTYVPLCDLLRDSEMVSLHASLHEGSARMIDATSFRQMRRGSWLINTARGELVDEAALLRALESGWLAGAALDVVCGEQQLTPATNPLFLYARTHRNLILTPHIGGCTEESMAKTEIFMARRLVEWRARLDVTQQPEETSLAHAL